MQIIRNGIAYTLTAEEMQQARKEMITDFMKATFQNTFDVKDESILTTLAEESYELYCKGDGKTEYECMESIYDKHFCAD